MSAPTEEYEPKEVMSEHVEKHELKNTDSVIQGSVSNIHIDLELEKQTLRKFDIFLLPQLAILVIIAYLDRSNIGEHTLLHALYCTLLLLD
jgi:hypothetical protein